MPGSVGRPAVERRLVIGVMGHVDHGKTALVRALTGMETDRLAEERRRGISIALGFAHLQAGDATIDLIDMPGHERFVRTMVAGAAGIGGVLLCVDAGEGIKPQTVEHLEVASLLGLRRGVVAVTRSDRVEAGRPSEVGAAGAALLASRGIACPPPVVCSALSGDGVGAVAAALAALAAGSAMVEDDGFAWLPIDRAFSVAGHGTVVTGTLRHGRLTAGETMSLLPDGRAVRLRGLQVHGAKVSAAEPGQRVAVNLRDVAAAEVRHGMALATPGSLAPADWITVALEVVRSAPRAVRSGERLVVLGGTGETAARLRLLDADSLEPGGSGLAQLHCEPPVVLPARGRAVLRQASPALTLGGGQVLEPASRRLKRRNTATLVRLGRLSQAEPAEVVRDAVAAAGMTGIRLAEAARQAGLGTVRAAAALQGAPVAVLRGVAIAEPALLQAASAVGRLVAEAGDAGIGRARLAAALPQVGAEVLAEAEARLVAAGRVQAAGSSLVIVSAAREQRRAEESGTLSDRIMTLIRSSGLAPPDRSELARADARLLPVLNRLVTQGALIQASDRVQKRDFLFHPEAIEDAKRQLAPLLGGGGLLTGEAGRALGITRKHAVPLLEHLDSVRFTRRVADRRVLA